MRMTVCGADRLAYDLVGESSGLGPEGAFLSRSMDATGDSGEPAEETSLPKAQSVKGRGV